MLDQLLANIAPHHCCSCTQIGSLLCDCCKNDILEQPFQRCIFCQNVVNDASLCSSHSLPYQNAWTVGWREEALGRLIDEFKFSGKREASDPLSELMDSVLPDIPGEVRVVPVPTTHKNIRLRGYDHMKLVAKSLAKRRSWRVESALRRQNNITQHFAKSAAIRRQQAASFFKATAELDASPTYLLIDDIYTTGSTINAAAQCLRDAGAKTVLVAVIACQRATNG